MVGVFCKICIVEHKLARLAAFEANTNAAWEDSTSISPRGVLPTSESEHCVAKVLVASPASQSEYIYYLEQCDTAYLFRCIALTARR